MQWCFSLGYGFNGTVMCIRHYIIIQTIGSDLARQAILCVQHDLAHKAIKARGLD